MATEPKRKRGRPKTAPDTTPIYVRMPDEVRDQLDAIGAAMDIEPSRSDLIVLACKEFIERRKKPKP